MSVIGDAMMAAVDQHWHRFDSLSPVPRVAARCGFFVGIVATSFVVGVVFGLAAGVSWLLWMG
jgi:hypothetical protein